MIIEMFIFGLIGIAEGVIVGCGFVAFLSVLGIIPRLTQLTKTSKMINFYEWSIVLGTLFGTWTGLRDIIFHLPSILNVPIGIACGMFVGMLAAALTEVINVVPILAKRIGIDGQLMIALMAIVFGKVIGSLFQWIYFIEQ